MIAISTFDLVGGRSANVYGPKVRTMVDLRARFQIGSSSQVLLVSVAPDADLERYWAYRNSRSVPAALRALGIVAVTIPNFSFFQDAPRTHTIRNRRRMEIVAEELSAAGIAVIPHLNALTRADWNYWADYLRRHESVTCVAKEFQTGLRDPALANEAIGAISQLEEKIGRPLHLIAVAGGGCVPQLARTFGRFTVVDSMPFMKTMKRRKLVVHGKVRWRRLRVPLVDDLLAHNVEGYTAHMEETAARFRQLQLPEIRIGARYAFRPTRGDS
jgi:hypothetical protein